MRDICAVNHMGWVLCLVFGLRFFKNWLAKQRISSNFQQRFLWTELISCKCQKIDSVMRWAGIAVPSPLIQATGRNTPYCYSSSIKSSKVENVPFAYTEALKALVDLKELGWKTGKGGIDTFLVQLFQKNVWRFNKFLGPVLKVKNFLVWDQIQMLPAFEIIMDQRREFDGRPF